MGEVFKDHDTRLKRTVAIKVLASPVASDPDLRQRVEREAKTLAALSHPRSCPVFDALDKAHVGISVTTVERDWQAARAWLVKELRGERTQRDYSREAEASKACRSHAAVPRAPSVKEYWLVTLPM